MRKFEVGDEGVVTDWHQWICLSKWMAKGAWILMSARRRFRPPTRTPRRRRRVRHGCGARRRPSPESGSTSQHTTTPSLSGHRLNTHFLTLNWKCPTRQPWTLFLFWFGDFAFPIMPWCEARIYDYGLRIFFVFNVSSYSRSFRGPSRLNWLIPPGP